jgi:hypothetical protein
VGSTGEGREGNKPMKEMKSKKKEREGLIYEINRSPLNFSGLFTLIFTYLFRYGTLTYVVDKAPLSTPRTNSRNVKVCDDCVLLQLKTSWTLFIALISIKNDVSETGICPS